MLALALPWRPERGRSADRLSERLANSLCAGIGGHAGHAEIDRLAVACRPLRTTAAQARAWRPSRLADGRIVLFNGYFDNAEEIASKLGADARDRPLLYGLAVARWGDEAERRIIGEYCAAIADVREGRLRLSRSALRAPPLHYFHDDELAAAASVPRAIFASGVDQLLNEQRVTDSSGLNFTDVESSWFVGLSRVPVGSVVELEHGQPRRLRQVYDLFAAPRSRPASDEECIRRVGELLDEGVRACIAGFERPGTTLSGGLDSPQVAVRTLAALPDGQPLPTFTFHPEGGFDGKEDRNDLSDERPTVEAFVAMHPGLEAHFTANEGYGHDHRWADFFHLMGGAPSGLCNMYVFHGLLSDARATGCDVLLLAEWGNYTFSDKGDWAFVEYFLKGRWKQLWQAWTRPSNLDGGPFKQAVARTFTAFLPDWAWRGLRRLAFPNRRLLVDLVNPLSPDYRHRSGADARVAKARLNFDRYQPWARRHAQRLLFQNDDAEGAEIYQAFEQMYGVAMRDPTAYRPLVEYCFGLPVEMFLRDGEMRWLAKRMAKGIMPEEQRRNRRNGRWDADWHLRIGRRRQDYLRELEELAEDEKTAAMLDLPRLRAALEDWPDETVLDPQRYFTAEFAVPRALLAARFMRFVEGRNTP